MKKLLSLVLTLTLLISALNCVSITTNAATTGKYNEFYYEIKNGEVTITGFDESTTNVVIPPVIETLPVTTIGEGAFQFCRRLTSVTIPNSVITISNNAFYYCEWLTNITIPDSVTTMGGGAFDGTAYYNNESNWNNSALYIGNHLIKVNSDFSGTFTIKDGTKTIAYAAFYGCESLLKVTIPDSVVSIGPSAFFCCGITSITIPKSVKSIGVAAFRGSPLESIIVDTNNPDFSSKDGVLFDKNKTKIIQFPEAKSGEYIIPNTVTDIYTTNFYNCNKITSITIPHSVKSIGMQAFLDCGSLESVVIGHGVTTIENGAFRNCASLQNITIGNSVESIGEEAFYGCYSLKYIDLPESVSKIGQFAFEECGNLKNIVIRNDDIVIGGAAFWELDKLTVTCNKNSSVQEYCEEWNIPYDFITNNEQNIIGDVNLDGTVDIFDLIALAKMIVGS